MPRMQGGICAGDNLHSLYLLFNAFDEEDEGIPRILADIANWLENSASHNADCAFSGFVAIGATYWDRLYPELRPKHLAPFPNFKTEDCSIPCQPIDIFIQIRSDRLDINHLAAMELCQRLAGAAELVEEIRGFRYLDRRDLFGFSYARPDLSSEQYEEIAFVDQHDPVFIGGSYIHIQRYVHNVSLWEKQSMAQQTQIMGCETLEDLSEANVVFPFSSFKRSGLGSERKESILLWQGMPYGTTKEQGLFFVSCCASSSHFVRLLHALVYSIGGKADIWLQYTQPVSGAAFFAPSLDFLEWAAGNKKPN